MVSVAVAPSAEWLEDAVRDGGGEVVGVEDAAAVVWTDPDDPDGLAALLAERPDVAWVQLPFAGVDAFLDVLDHDRTWTAAQGVYAEPVAEHALALTLALLRALPRYAGATSWGDPHGRNLLGARVSVLGGGAITTSLLRLLGPFGCEVTVLTRHPRPLDGAGQVVGPDRLDAALDGADVVVLALALTPQTRGIVDADALARLPGHAVVVNVARGAHVDTDALVAALQDGRLGGAGLDVTDPEPLPDGHPLWTRDDVVITPHVGNTPEMGRPLLAARVRENVRRRVAGEELLGRVDVDLGY